MVAWILAIAHKEKRLGSVTRSKALEPKVNPTGISGQVAPSTCDDFINSNPVFPASKAEEETMLNANETNETNDDYIDHNTNSLLRKQAVTPEQLQQLDTPEQGEAKKQKPRKLKRSALPSLSTTEDERTKWNVSELTTIMRRADCGQRLRETILGIYEGLPQGAEERCRSFRDLENDLGLKPGTLKNRSREAKEVSERIGRDLWTVYGASVTGDGTSEDDYHASWQSLRGLFAVRQEVAEVAFEAARKTGAFFEGATWDDAKWTLDPAQRKAIWLTAVNEVCQWKRKPRKEPKAKGKATPDNLVAIAQGIMLSLKRTCKEQGEKTGFHLRRIVDCAQEILLDCDDDDTEAAEAGVEITPVDTHAPDPYADRIVPIGNQGVKKESLLKESFGEGEFTPPPDVETVQAPSKAELPTTGVHSFVCGDADLADLPRPVVEVVPSDIPSELRELRQFVGWKYVEDTSRPKPPKVPINPATGHNARVSDSSSWGTFEQAMMAVERFGLDGIGFVLTAGDPFVCVDLDGCRDLDTGELTGDTWNVVDALYSYTEISPSGTGVHVWCMGELPDGGRRKGKVEMYFDGRFICMTGARVTDTPSSVELRGAELGDLHRRVFGALDPARSTSTTQQTVYASSCSEDELQKIILRSKDAGLYRDKPAIGASANEGDLALVSRLLFYTRGDGARVDALFRASGRMRPKWDEVHRAADRATYGAMTIELAQSNHTGGYYTGRRPWRN